MLNLLVFIAARTYFFVKRSMILSNPNQSSLGFDIGIYEMPYIIIQALL
ncbi:hypothetical protein JCM19300_42 [Algibacter lectus]|uniref:Uncharacterized protein n=1 Tax=Algibacter lectus TaxID=221126 RepID=A0A090WBW5_9FLAO|nr:hypothetical protein DFQ06_0577 [Algibacter lectus]GAL65007.1 hypothetical protein JCM19300_42 [Algibacter lectus]SFC34165.1 hypothetical protein SAMN04489722_102242 [Algibacter lectus]